MPSHPSAPPSSPRAARASRTLAPTWLTLLLVLGAPGAWAGPPPVDFEKAAASAEVSGEVVRVAPDFETTLIVRGAERVLVDRPDVAQAAMSEPDQVSLQGVQSGHATLLVLRKGARPLRVRVEVAK